MREEPIQAQPVTVTVDYRRDSEQGLGQSRAAESDARPSSLRIAMLVAGNAVAICLALQSLQGNDYALVPFTEWTAFLVLANGLGLCASKRTRLFGAGLFLGGVVTALVPVLYMAWALVQFATY